MDLRPPALIRIIAKPEGLSHYYFAAGAEEAAASAAGAEEAAASAAGAAGASAAGAAGASAAGAAGAAASCLAQAARVRAAIRAATANLIFMLGTHCGVIKMHDVPTAKSTTSRHNDCNAISANLNSYCQLARPRPYKVNGLPTNR
jgi:hypothetical protein